MRTSEKRAELLRELQRLGRQILFGTLSQTYRRCGQPTCACHHGGAKHGPHLQISYRSETGKTSGYHVPAALHDDVQAGVAAWQRLQAVARELAELNRERVWAPHRQRKAR
jgi:hypothetical protein